MEIWTKGGGLNVDKQLEQRRGKNTKGVVDVCERRRVWTCKESKPCGMLMGLVEVEGYRGGKD